MHVELKKLQKSHTFEVGKSSRVNQQPHVPSFVSMGEDEVYMNFPYLFASADVRAQALQMAESWTFEKIQKQLLKHQISISVWLHHFSFVCLF